MNVSQAGGSRLMAAQEVGKVDRSKWWNGETALKIWHLTKTDNVFRKKSPLTREDMCCHNMIASLEFPDFGASSTHF